MSVAVRLNRALEYRDLSKRKLQLALKDRDVKGASYASVYGYFGDKQPPLDFLAAAADLLGVRRAWLAFGDGPMTEQEATPPGVGEADFHRAQRLQDKNAVTDMIREYTTDSALNSRSYHGRLAALMRFAQKVDDAVNPIMPFGSRSPLYADDGTRRELMKAAARFLVGVEIAFREAGQPRPSRIQGLPAEGGAPAGLLIGDDSFAGWYATWADGVLDLFARRVAGLGSPMPAPTAEPAVRVSKGRKAQGRASRRKLPTVAGGRKRSGE